MINSEKLLHWRLGWKNNDAKARMGACLDIRGVDGIRRHAIDVYKLFSSAAAGAYSPSKDIKPQLPSLSPLHIATPEKLLLLSASHSDSSISLLRFSALRPDGVDSRGPGYKILQICLISSSWFFFCFCFFYSVHFPWRFTPGSSLPVAALLTLIH